MKAPGWVDLAAALAEATQPRDHAPEGCPGTTFDSRAGLGIAMLDSTPNSPSNDRRSDMALDDDMTTPPREPSDEATPADRAEGTVPEDQYLGRDSLADLEADGGADGPADRPADGSGAGSDDPTTATDEDARFA